MCLLLTEKTNPVESTMLYTYLKIILYYYSDRFLITYFHVSLLTSLRMFSESVGYCPDFTTLGEYVALVKMISKTEPFI